LSRFNRLKRWTNLANSTTLSKQLLALPMAYDLTFDEQEKVVGELKTAIS
jgi:dTDP-4-amino-4,6-dideoxygalactose transaminase